MAEAVSSLVIVSADIVASTALTVDEEEDEEDEGEKETGSVECDVEKPLRPIFWAKLRDTLRFPDDGPMVADCERGCGPTWALFSSPDAFARRGSSCSFSASWQNCCTCVCRAEGRQRRTAAGSATGGKAERAAT